MTLSHLVDTSVLTRSDSPRFARPSSLAAARWRGRELPDLLIAAAAEERGVVVLHYDADFDRIAALTALTGQPCAWVVEPGRVD